MIWCDFGCAGVGIVALRRSPFGRRLVALRDRQAELRKTKAALESQLNALIEKMDF